MSAPHDLDRRLDDWLAGRAVPCTRALDRGRPRPRRHASAAARPAGGPAPRPDGLGRARHGRAALGAARGGAGAAARGGAGGGHGRRPVPAATRRRAAAAVDLAGPIRGAVGVGRPSPARRARSRAPRRPTIRVDLVDDIGGRAYVEITDHSGTLVRARSGQSSEAGPATGDIGANNLAGDPASIVLSWVGCPSDTRHVLTIAADRRTMTLDQPVCQGDTLGVDRVLVLTFDSAVPAADVDVSIRHTGG